MIAQLGKNSTISAILWSFFQRAGGLIIGFIANIILARLLIPDDFGVVGILLIFVSFANIIVDGGFGSALIFKKQIDQNDISTVFTINLIISIVLFSVIFIFAPYVSVYLEIPKLDLYLRIESISIVIRAFYVVQTSILNKELKFKDLAVINLISSSISVAIAVTLALSGVGVWSLISKNIVLQICLCILFNLKSKVKFRLSFQKKLFIPLFKYGWFVALTNFIDVFYANTIAFIIGKKGSVADLGYYNQAASLQQIPSYSISQIICQVLFPFMVKYQDDYSKIKSNATNVLYITSVIIFPIFTFLIYFAEPIITFIYSSKWLQSAFYFKILCIGGLVEPIVHINRNILKSIGKTDYLYRSQLFSTLIGILLILLIVILSKNVKIMVVCIVVNTYFNYLITSYYLCKGIGYSIFSQIRDVLPSLLISVFSVSVVTNIIKLLELKLFPLLLLSFLLYVIFYVLINRLISTRAFSTTINYIFSKDQ